MSFAAGSYVWIPDEEEVVIPAKVVSTFSAGSPGEVIPLGKDKKIKLTAADTKNITQMHEQSLKGEDDMVAFKELNESSILHNLRERFGEDKIYTNIGRILTSVNPFKQLPIYSPEVLDKYMENGSRKMPPHVYGVADDAFNAMVDNKKNQSCIVSGESGAGKTEATKVFLSYVSEKSKSKASTDGSGTDLAMQQKILESNPLLEGFGNAKTVRNDNSSRFGKWIEVQFNRGDGAIVGGSIKNYLLEKSRIVNQADNERNYHVFYQFCAGAAVDPGLSSYGIKDATQYHYTNQSKEPCTTVESIDDVQDWGATMNAMERIGISEDNRKQVLNILALVLNLGNVNFTGTDVAAATPESKSILTRCGELMGCSADDLERSVVKVDRSNPADKNLVGNLDLGQAIDARDAFSKYIYSLLFDWLISQTNLSLGRVKDSANISSIGVLDIFGFEFFENNSFEQLCINYCNERLQGHFNEHIFKLEQREYEKEGLDVTKIDFVDNEHVIKTIDLKATGILQIIANELKLKTATDMTLLTKLKKAADSIKDENLKVISYPTNKEVKASPALDQVFRVNHYAGKVSYRIEQFLEKNRDAVPALITKLGKSCGNPFIKSLFAKSEQQSKVALGVRFSTQLKALMGDLNATEPHYIRCVKPNAEKKSDIFTSNMVLAQLRYAGLLEVCRIRKMGYPVRREHVEFYKRYKLLVDSAGSDHVSLVEALKKDGMITDGHLQIGNSQVFMKTGQSDILEEQRGLSLSKVVKDIQRVIRGYLVRIRAKAWVKARKQMKDAISSREKALLKAALLAFGSLPYGGKHLAEYKQGKELMNRIDDEERITKLLQNAIAGRDLEQIRTALKAAEEKELGNTKLAHEAKDLINLIEREKECEVALRLAIEKKEEAGLQGAIKMAQVLNLQQLPTFKDAEALLNAINKEKNCRKNLKDALAANDVANIKTYMNQMADIGKGDDPLVKEGEKVVKEKARVAAEISARNEALIFSLQKAMRDRNLAALNELEMETIDLGLENEITAKAKELRENLQKEMDICAKLNAESTAVVAKSQTKAGLMKKDIEVLKTLITEADEILQADDFQLLSAKNDLHRLENQLQIQDELHGVVEFYKEKKAELAKVKEPEKREKIERELIEKLSKANEVAVEAGADTEAASEVKEKLNQLRLEIDERNADKKAAEKKENREKLNVDKEQTEEALKEREEKRENFFSDTMSKNHRQLIEEASDSTRYALKKFFKIRTDDDFVEKIHNDLKSTVAQNKLRSQSKVIAKSLMRVDIETNKIALRINKAILQYCGDLSSNFPATLAQFVVSQALEDKEIVDEIYAQLVKHITDNPKPDSQDRAWLLMCICTRTFPPTADFSHFLVNFLIQNRGAVGLIGNYARLCIVQLDATIELGASSVIPLNEEIAGYRKRPPILANIHTLEGNVIAYPVTPEMRVSAVLKLMKMKLGMKVEADDEEEEEDENNIWGIYVSAEEEVKTDDPRDRLARFYAHYNPSKLAHVDLFLDHWKENVEELFQKLVFKYGAEPVEDSKNKKKGMLSLPITAAIKAVNFLGFGAQKEQPPAPQTSWPLPWWTHLGDVYFRMTRQKKTPMFVFKRRMVRKDMPVDHWLYLQAVDDVRNGYLPIKEKETIVTLTTLSMAYEHGNNFLNAEGLSRLKELNVEKFIPNTFQQNNSYDAIAGDVLANLKGGNIPTNKDAIMKQYIEKCHESPVYGMNFFYARHSASEKNYVIAVNIDGIHVLEEDRSNIKRSFNFDTIKKFGATAEYFWMTIDERQETEKVSKFKFLNPNQGINVLLYTLQSWEMYDCVYDATHVGVDDEESQ